MCSYKGTLRAFAIIWIPLLWSSFEALRFLKPLVAYRRATPPPTTEENKVIIPVRKYHPSLQKQAMLTWKNALFNSSSCGI